MECIYLKRHDETEKDLLNRKVRIWFFLISQGGFYSRVQTLYESIPELFNVSFWTEASGCAKDVILNYEESYNLLCDRTEGGEWQGFGYDQVGLCLSVCLVRFSDFVKGIECTVYMDALVQRGEVYLQLVIVQDIICKSSDNTSAFREDQVLHSIFSYVTTSTALPTRLDFNDGSFSRLLLHLRVLVSMASRANCPTCALIFLMSSSHCFTDAFTASLIWPRSDGSDDSTCWNKGVCDRDVGGILSMSSNDYKANKWNIFNITE